MVSGRGEDLAPEVVLDYDANGNLVGIDIDIDIDIDMNASTKVELGNLILSKLPARIETIPA